MEGGLGAKDWEEAEEEGGIWVLIRGSRAFLMSETGWNQPKRLHWIMFEKSKDLIRVF